MNEGINLRPWRDERRQQQKAQFYFLAIIAFTLSLVFSAFWLWINNQALQSVQQENRFIEKQLEQLNQEAQEITRLRDQRSQLLQPIQTLQNLQYEHAQTIEWLDQLAASLAPDIYITELRRQEQTLYLHGQAKSLFSLSKWMRQLEQQSRFKEPILRHLTLDTATDGQRFELHLPLNL